MTGLAAWWRRTSERWLRNWLERMRRDPDVSLAEFRDVEKAFHEHLEWCDEQERTRKEARRGR